MSTKRLRLRAPELVGSGGWINTGGRSLALADLRGKIVLLDFWTFCCVNCLHVLDELRPLEAKYDDVLVTIGVHSPKFAHEANHDAVKAAVERYGVDHPVLSDPELKTWDQYAVRAWPTLAVIDPEGYVVGQLSGEGHAHALDVLIGELVSEHEAKGTLHRGEGPFVPSPPSQEVFSFPSKAKRFADGRLLVSDTAHHMVKVLSAGDVKVEIGCGRRGLVDGPKDQAQFSEPNGIAILPVDVAARVGYDIVIADTVNHAIRAIDSSTWITRTIAGTGRQWMQGDVAQGIAIDTALSSPWDVAWFDGALIIAMAGVHRIDRLDLDAGTIAPYAGTTNEGIVDGQLVHSWFAQTSGLAASVDCSTLWCVDSETSALRRIRNGLVTTVVGQGLFDFGHRDGEAGQALLQHPLGVAVLPDDSVVVADTYNGAIRRYDPSSHAVTTIAMDLAEPSDVLVVPAGEQGHDEPVLLVVESAAHRLTTVKLPRDAMAIDGDLIRTQRPSTDVRPGSVVVEVVFTPPTGQKMDERYGPARFMVISASPPELLVDGAGNATDLERTIVIADPRQSGITSGVLHVSARCASCDDPDAEGAAEFPACHVHQQDWGVPIVITDNGTNSLELMLAGRSA
jgi:thiol-disulfide isomerase/thioredoxin/sugar lactone lactonase YvrE